MWYKNSYRRHLLDMHIDDRNDEFLSEFSPEEYFENLKKAKIQNAMLYFQSHVGLCYYPTKSGKMHNAFRGREDMMKRLAAMCRKNGISVTGYYSFIFNNWAAHTHPEWKIVPKGALCNKNNQENFSSAGLIRYGVCCPNNREYRNFVSEQIKEICEYFEFDGMFFDMLYWPELCYCPSCKERFRKETGFELPEKEDWNDRLWLLHISKRREWMGLAAQSLTDEVKNYLPNVSVEHNVAFAALPNGKNALAEGVLNASDYAGGDLYGNTLYTQSFTCKFYKNATKNQPFEYMISRCEPNLSKHTVTKSDDTLLSQIFLTYAHHGASLIIDAVDPIGTTDSRVFEKIGGIFGKTLAYEKYFSGNMAEDVGIYYTHRSKFNAYGESYSNHTGCVNSVKLMIEKNICCGVTGGYHDISNYKLLIAPLLTEEDSYDYQRITEYVRNGGFLYISGGDCCGLLKEFFNTEITGRTHESIVYIAPDESKSTSEAFGWFNRKYPLHFDGTAPIADSIDENNVIAHITLPYTTQNNAAFASIHSDPPGIQTKNPAIAITEYGKGKVMWSALPFECIESPYQCGEVFINLIDKEFPFEKTFVSDAPQDVEITVFKDKNSVTVSSVLMCTSSKARHTETFTVAVKSENKPYKLINLPDESDCDFEYKNGYVKYTVDNLKIFDMKKIIF